jgi:molecular chaperone DnaK (HSP70)
MTSDEILPLHKAKIPTVVGFDRDNKVTTIGDAARSMGLNGRPTVFNFKPVFGLGDKEFSKDKKFWYWAPAADGKGEHVETFSAKDASVRFLRTLLAQTSVPGKVIIGEPAIRDEN